jgi:hypothetical protein
MSGLEGRHQWRQHKLFKLRAKLLQRKKYLWYNQLGGAPKSGRERRTHPKFAIRLFLVRRTINKQSV